MKPEIKNPPRTFRVGKNQHIEIKDCAHIELDADEQVTLKTSAGAEYDVARKSWGFYATPSLNGRLPSFGLRAVLIKCPDGKFFILLVEKGKEAEFEDYMASEGQELVTWLDSDEALRELEEGCKKEKHAG